MSSIFRRLAGRAVWILPLLLALPACITQLFDQIVPVVLSDVERRGVFTGPPVYVDQEFVNWETPHVSPLALTPDGATLLAVNTPDNRLEIFDAGDGLPTPRARVFVGLEPVSVRVRDANEAWVVNHLSDSVSIVDLPTASVRRTLHTGDEPTDVAFASGRAFVVCSQINEVWVFDLDDLDAAPARVTIVGEDPRMIQTAADGQSVWVAIFESGNATTILPVEIVEDPSGPYGGQNPPPSAALENATAPPGPRNSLIVRRDIAGRWRDDQGGDWTELVPWDVIDHDLARIDAATLDVSYVGGLMNLDMALAARHDGTVAVIGTDARNEQRFEPQLKGDFVTSLIALVAPDGGVTRVDLNPHLEAIRAAGVRTLPIEQRSESLADPRGIVWRADGSAAYVTGLGSDNLVRIDAAGGRTGVLPLGAGPTGLALDDGRGLLYVLNRFDASISVIDEAALRETGRVAFFDPTPAFIRTGRKFLYDARLTSGLGTGSCAACHVDGRMDQLAWELGDPDGTVAPFDQECDSLLGPLRPARCDDFHPLKGPMITQTLQGIIGTEPLHWRGDRRTLADFNPAFAGLLGNDRMLTPNEMAQFEAFVATITYPPNPYRNIDNSLKTDVFGGNALRGFTIYVNEPIDSIHAAVAAGAIEDFLQPALLRTRPILTCNRCHELWDGTNGRVTSGTDLGREQGTKVAQLRGMYEKTGFSKHEPGTRGFGFTHNGQFATIDEFLRLTNFDFGGGQSGDQRRTDVIAFVMSLGVDTHAGVGQQATLPGGSDAEARVRRLQQIADVGEVSLVVHGRLDGRARGFAYRGGGLYDADRAGEQASLDSLIAAAGPDSVLTWTIVPRGSQTRVGIDRDGNGVPDGDE